MNIVRQPIEDFVIEASHMLKDALIAITNNRKGSLVVVDQDGRYLGVVSDGDIRRAMVKGATEFTPIEKFVNTNGFFQSDNVTDEEIKSSFEAHPEITLIPLVGASQAVTSVALLTK